MAEALARNMALRNPQLSDEDLNKAVQLTIDRIIFLRMAEDRGIEQDERLLKLTERPEIYRHFIKDVCRTADDKYNSGLFHFEEEAGVESEPDKTDAAPCRGRQGPQADPAELVFSVALRLSGDARRDSRQHLRAVSGQGHSTDEGPPGQGGGKARGPQGGRRLLHAGLHRRLHRQEHGWAR